MIQSHYLLALITNVPSRLNNTTAGLCNALSSSLQDVESFYVARYAIIEQRKADLSNLLGNSSFEFKLSDVQDVDVYRARNALAAFLELRVDLKK